MFEADQIRQLPSGLGGVYVLSAFTPFSATLVPFYVGQSNDLARRLGEHLSGDRTFARHLRRSLSTYFHVAQVSAPALRTAVEAALIRRLSPAGNSVVPDALAVALNLPDFALLPTN